jgi:hypothetical protein
MVLLSGWVQLVRQQHWYLSTIASLHTYCIVYTVRTRRHKVSLDSGSQCGTVHTTWKVSFGYAPYVADR